MAKLDVKWILKIVWSVQKNGILRYTRSMGEPYEHANRLYWEASYEIVLTLMDVHPDANLDELGLEQLYLWIIALPNFVDDPALANESILTDILREWYEEVNQI